MAGDTERQVIKWVRKLNEELVSHPVASPVEHAWRQLEGHVDQMLDERSAALKRPVEEWSTGLLAVASEDLGAARVLLAAGEHPAVWCMLLQMAFEKIAKAAIARSDEQCFRKVRLSHSVLSRFFAILDRQLSAIEFPRHEFKIAKSTLLSIERAHPALARGGPHLEYPWEDEQGVYTPHKDLALLSELTDSKNLHANIVVRFGFVLLRRFEQLF